MALAKEDWLITHDPYPLQAGNLDLAISSDVYEKLFLTIFIQNIIKQNDIYLVICNLEKEEIEQWIP